MREEAKVLVIEDDAVLRRLLQLYLSGAGYGVVEAVSGEEGLRGAYRERPDLIVLDIMLPGVDGWEVCERLRQLCDVPILILSAKGLVGDRVRGLQLGADDYVTKPFDMRELLLRMRAILRRVRGPIGYDSEYSDGYLSLRLGEGMVMREGHLVSLTSLELQLLACLLRRRGRPVNPREILQEVWGPEYGGEVHYVKNYIRRLRQKIEEDPSDPQYILTERGIGYRFVGVES